MVEKTTLARRARFDAKNLPARHPDRACPPAKPPGPGFPRAAPKGSRRIEHRIERGIERPVDPRGSIQGRSGRGPEGETPSSAARLGVRLARVRSAGVPFR